MEIQLFDTELNMSPVDIKQIPKENEETEEKGGLQEVVDDPEKEYTIIEVLDKKQKEGKETEEVEESKDTKEKTTSEQSADSSKFPYSTFAKALYEEGVISFFDENKFKELVEESGSEVDALIELNRQTIGEQVDAYKNSLSPEGQAFLEALEKGVPLDRYIQLKSSESSFSSIKEDALEDNDELCKSLIKTDLKMKGFDDEEIDDQIKDFDSLGKLETKAKSALKKVKAVFAEQIQNEKIEAEKRNQEAIEENKKHLVKIKSEIDKISEIIPGTKIPERLKGELYNVITTPTEQMPNGQWVNAVYAKRAKDPISWDIKVAYLDKLGVFDGKWDNIIKSSKSAATKDLADKLRGGDISATGEPGVPEVTPKAKDILRSMESFRTKK